MAANDTPQVRNCGTMVVHERLLRTDPAYVAARNRSENAHWERLVAGGPVGRAGVTTIPVVVHVVWKTAAQNISDAQIHSQIDVLNRDFRKTNPDNSKTPGVFAGLVADGRIQFQLASSDPGANPTNGITRTNTASDSFSDDNKVKSSATGGANAWPRDKYLNLWVCQLGGGLLGYAQFPGGPAATDGVVILHTGFGTCGSAAAPFNLGRTATHEIGHWLNLRHIWGDDGTACNGDDFVADTPNAAGPNFGKPTFPHVTCNNGPNGDLFMNYMDYTDDDSMFMFTHGQVARMQTSLDADRPTIGLVPASTWEELDNNPATARIVAAADHLYQLHNTGRIWIYTGPPHTGWQELDDNPATSAIVAAKDHLYQLHKTGRIWVYTGTPHTGWQELDNNPATSAIVAANDHLYQLHKTGRIWVYTGTPHTGWQELDNNPATTAIVAANDHLYQLHNTGRIWVYTGTPHTGWQELDNNPATSAIVAANDHLYQLHKTGRIWVYTGTPHTGWQEIDNNPATVAIVAANDHLYQRHNTGRIWRYTGTPHTGWQQLDNNPATTTIVAASDHLYQLHNTGRIWRYVGA